MSTLRLIVMRHAKAVSDAPSDRLRALTERGRRDASEVGQAIVSLGWAPDLVISSDAVRTVETWHRILASCPPGTRFRETPRLYGAGPDTFCAVVRELTDAKLPRTLLILGHNPGWEQVVAWLTGVVVPLGTANAALLAHKSTGPASTGPATWAAALTPDAFRVETVLRPGS